MVNPQTEQVVPATPEKEVWIPGFGKLTRAQIQKRIDQMIEDLYQSHKKGNIKRIKYYMTNGVLAALVAKESQIREDEEAQKMKPVTEQLDKLASELEPTMPRLALAIDRVSDSLEKVAAGGTKEDAVRVISALQDIWDRHPKTREAIQNLENALMKEFGITDKELIQHDVDK